MWEKGKFKPKGEKKAALVALRKFRKREVQRILAEKQESKVQVRKKAGGKERKKKVARKVPRKRAKCRRVFLKNSSRFFQEGWFYLSRHILNEGL
jgi:hypothetical protein